MTKSITPWKEPTTGEEILKESWDPALVSEEELSTNSQIRPHSKQSSKLPIPGILTRTFSINATRTGPSLLVRLSTKN